MRCSNHDVITPLCRVLVLLSTAAIFGHVFPVSEAYTTTLTQQFTVAEEQPAGTLIGRVAGVRPPLKAYFRAGSDAERDLTVCEDDGSIRARSRIDREALSPSSSAKYRFLVTSASDDATMTVTVFVADINDHTPTFPDDLVELTVSEAAPLGLRLSLLPAVDRDIGTNAVQVYTTTSDETIERSQLPLISLRDYHCSCDDRNRKYHAVATCEIKLF